MKIFKKKAGFIFFMGMIFTSCFFYSCNQNDSQQKLSVSKNEKDDSLKSLQKSVPDSISADNSVVREKIYRLLSYNGKRIEGDFTLSLDRENNINAHFCNTIFGKCTVTGLILKGTNQVASTQMACAEQGKMELEKAFLDGLTEGFTVIRMGKQFSLMNRKGISFLFELA